MYADVQTCGHRGLEVCRHEAVYGDMLTFGNGGLEAWTDCMVTCERVALGTCRVVPIRQYSGPHYDELRNLCLPSAQSGEQGCGLAEALCEFNAPGCRL